MTVKRRIAGIAAAVLMGLGFVAVSAAPAQAQGEACGSWNLCFWQSANPLGYPPTYSMLSPNYSTCMNFTSLLNDKVLSLKMTFGWSMTMYQHTGCTGQAIVTVYDDQFKRCGDPTWYAIGWPGCGGPNGGSSIWYQHPTN